jgi:putative NADH-flavin reductase
MARIAVFGAGGRAGRAVTAEARERGHVVTAVVRDPSTHRDIEADGVGVLRGDITHPQAVASAAAGADAAVHAVTPASSPDQLGDFDRRFYIKATDALLEGLPLAGVSRLLAIGLFATLRDGGGHSVFDDPSIFPARLRPFALAHAAGLEQLQAAGTQIDWLMLTPPAQLELDAPRTGRYRIGGDTLPDPGSARLSYADLAVAIVDEIETPTHHRARVSVFN